MDSFSRGSQRLRPPTGRWVLKGNGPQDSHLGLGSIPVCLGLGSIPVALRECEDHDSGNDRFRIIRLKNEKSISQAVLC